MNSLIEVFWHWFLSLVASICQQNRPLNVQNVADALQKFNLKKTAVQKALDALADSGQISFKEYGKQKIYLARQDRFNIPNAQELDQMKNENAKLQEEVATQMKATSEVEAGKKTCASVELYYQFRNENLFCILLCASLKPKLEGKWYYIKSWTQRRLMQSWG